MTLILTGCGKSEKQKGRGKRSKTLSSVRVLTQEEREFEKAKLFGIKSRSTFSRFYDKYGKVPPKGFLVEKSTFDEDGKRIENNLYTSTGEINLNNKFEYDDDNLIKIEVLNNWGKIKFRRISEYDEFGNETVRKELNLKLNLDDNSVFEYDNEGELVKTIYYDPKERLVSIENYSCDDKGRLISKNMLDPEDKLIAGVTYEYDSLGHVVTEIKSFPNSKTTRTDYKFDQYGNQIEVDAGYYKNIMEYDNNGNVILEAMYAKGGALQQKFKNFYDHRGLLLERIRYDGMEKPAVYINYEYEFY